MFGLLAKKRGMTQIFDADGNIVPVTVLEAGPCVVISRKNKQHDGYSALQLAFEPCEERRLKKPRLGLFKKKGIAPHAYMREFVLDENIEIAEGKKLSVNFFRVGDMVNVSGMTKGRGFQGVMKRHGKAGGPAAHGSDFHRRPGSIGMRTWPARVFKNTRLPGHMGVERVTIRNLEVVAVHAEENVLLVRGAVPGFNGTLLEVTSTDHSLFDRDKEETKPEANEVKANENIQVSPEEAK